MVRFPARTIQLLDKENQGSLATLVLGQNNNNEKVAEKDEKMLPLDSVTSSRSWAEIHSITLKHTSVCWQKSG